MPLYNLDNTQKNVANDIESAFLSGFLPQALLFAGSRGSSRLTGALDLSFLLLDDMKNRVLLKTSQVLFLPSRNLDAEIKAALSIYSRQRTDRARVFLLQSARKILMQYHSALLDAYDKKILSYFSVADEIATLLYDYEERRDYSEKEVKSLVSFLQKNMTTSFINKGRKSPVATIDEIRAIQDWFSSGSDVKIAILENIEDSTEATKNSLLKMLEEPMPNAHMILISSNPQKLLQTILSRVRKFTFPSLTSRQVSAFLKDYFSLYNVYSSFEAFFFQEGASEEDKESLEKAVGVFSNAIVKSVPISDIDKEDLFTSIDKLNSYHYFLERIANEISKAMISGSLKPVEAKERMDIINKWVLVSDTYNLSLRASLDGILREVASVK